MPSEAEAPAIVDVARLSSTGPLVHLPEMITFLDDEIAHRLSSARAWTKMGYDMTGSEWARNIAVLDAMLRLFTMIEANPEAQKAVGAALRRKPK